MSKNITMEKLAAAFLNKLPKQKMCLYCKELFFAGYPVSDRRRDAKFCSDEHRKRFNSLARSR